MCCFSQPVQFVADTRMFARREGDRQYLVYQMSFQSAEPNAMILPIPVALPAAQESVRFISLKACPTFFDDLNLLFPILQKVSRSASRSRSIPEPQGYLPVESVGDFVASFVPTMADFSRLDPRFVIKQEVWHKIPAYTDYGFVVFQLDAPSDRLATVHPMALTFRTRLSDDLFFPTIHIHDGQVHDKEMFDHQFYWQGQKPMAPSGWVDRIRALFDTVHRPSLTDHIESAAATLPAAPNPIDPTPQELPFKSIHEAALERLGSSGGVFDPEQSLHRWSLTGTQRNVDTFV